MGTEAEKQVRKVKTRCYYTDYVNHMIRFYLSTPESIETNGKRGADIANWIAVQEVWHKLGTEDRITLEKIYRLHHKVAEGVKMYCEETGTEDAYSIWVLITKTNQAIARKRGLI